MVSPMKKKRGEQGREEKKPRNASDDFFSFERRQRQEFNIRETLFNSILHSEMRTSVLFLQVIIQFVLISHLSDGESY